MHELLALKAYRCHETKASRVHPIVSARLHAPAALYSQGKVTCCH
jgi:hypothetical protein